ncbi:MAG: fibrobacter succinogenes major paralogous domain-containing protein [Bacteroidota bacterium]
MQKAALRSGTILFLAITLLLQGCKKKNSEEPAVVLPVAVVSTGTGSKILLTTVDFTGSVSNDQGAFVTRRGFCWSRTNQNPTIGNDTMVSGDGSGDFTGTLKGLRGQSKYYVRAFATNRNGTGYGSTCSVTTIDSTMTDQDNNHYRMVQVGKQVWMRENLRATTYRSGNPISLVTDSIAWIGAIWPSYCWYNNDPVTFSGEYGALYNFYAVSNGNLAPAGWHIPTGSEFTTLVDFLGGESVAGGKLKEAGLSHWGSPNSGADNSSGFTGLPGGERFPWPLGGIYGELNTFGKWWSSSPYSSSEALLFSLRYDNASGLVSYAQMNFGLSIRCLRDEQ